MALSTYVRPMGRADTDAVRRLGKAWSLDGRAPSTSTAYRAATLIGRVGKVVLGDGIKENILGFLIGTVAYPLVKVDWLVSEPNSRRVVIRYLVSSVRAEFPGFDLQVRIPNVPGKYELLTDVRVAAGHISLPPRSLPWVTDEQSSHVFFTLRSEEPADDGSGRKDGPKALGGDTYFARRA